MKINEPRPGMGKGSVTDGDPDAKPKGDMWDRLEKVKTYEDLKELTKLAKARGYAPEGQFMQAVRDRRKELV